MSVSSHKPSLITASFASALLLLTATALLAPATAQAQSDTNAEPEYSRPSPIESDQIVRRKLLFRSTRFEIAPLAGFTLADPLNRNLMAGANLSFHLTNEFSIGATFGYGVSSSPTSLREALESPETQVPDSTIASLASTRVNWLASVEGGYVPIFGKLSLLNALILNYDLHFIVGVGFVNLAGVTQAGQVNAASDGLAVSTVAPVVGVGSRFYINDFVSFNLGVRDYIYSSPVISNGTNNDGELQNQLMLSVGLSFFLPTAVKVSR